MWLLVIAKKKSREKTATKNNRKTANCCQQNLSKQQVFARIQTERRVLPTRNMHQTIPSVHKESSAYEKCYMRIKVKTKIPKV